MDLPPLAVSTVNIDLKQLARSIPGGFAKYHSRGASQNPPHLQLIDAKLMQVARGTLKRLMVFCPPRHGKSERISRTFPAWYLGNWPDKRVILSSYEADFAADWGRKARDLLLAHGPALWGVRVAQGTSAANRWTIEGHTGGMATAGVGGPITGKGADLFIIDDPVKNAEEANSEVYRDKTWEWFRSTAYTRLEPGGAIVLVQCVAEGERVCMADGTWRPIETVTEGEEVVGYDRGRYVPRRVVAVRCSGEDDTLRVRAGGRSLRVNARHPFLLKSGEWRRAEDLAVGDEVVVLDEILWGEPHDEDFAWLFGFLMGDGWVTTWRRRNWDRKRGKCYESRSWAVLCARSVYPELNERVRGAMARHLGGRVWETSERCFRIDSADAGRRLDGLGLKAGVRAPAKRIPEWIFASSPACRRAFLRGLAESDGAKLKGSRDAWRIGSASYGLLSDATLLAMGCGVRMGRILEFTTFVKPPGSKSVPERGWKGYSLYLNFAPSRADGTRRPDARTARIDLVEPAGRSRVYDLSVEGSENFVAEGFVVHNTRWHEDDLAGRLIKEMAAGGEQWEVVNLPAIAESGDPLGRQVGEPLWPERFDAKAIWDIKGTLGTYWFSAMYQGRPSPEGGGFFRKDWFKYYDFEADDWVRMSHDDRRSLAGTMRFSTVDLACSTKTSADYTAIATWACTHDGYLMLLDLDRRRLEGPQILPAIESALDKWKAGFVGIESGGFQLSLVQAAWAAGLPARELKPDKDKVSRAIPATARMEAGRVLLPRGAPWLADFEAELLAFPGGTHDECVDVLGYAVEAARQYQPASPQVIASAIPIVEEEPEPEEERDLARPWLENRLAERPTMRWGDGRR